MVIKVDVTQEDIDATKPGALGDKCAVHRAIARTTGDESYHVGMTSVYHVGMTSIFRYGADIRYWPLPGEVTAWITCRDNKLPVEPFSFEMELG